MIDQSQISTISDLRFKTKDVLKKVKVNPVYLFHRSSPKGVILSMEKYKEMTDALEDYFLSLKVGEYETEDKKSVNWTEHNEVRKLIKAND